MAALVPVRPATILLCCLAIIYSADHARGARFSFRAGSSYRYTSYGSYRYTYRTATRTSTSLSGAIRGSFSSQLQILAISRGLFYSSYRWRTRYVANTQPEGISLCFNVNEALTAEQSAAVLQPWYYQNRSVLGVYVCPLDDNADMKYCCGDELGETCCTFWQSPARLAGVIVGILVFIAFGAVLAWKFGRRFFSVKSPSGAAYAMDPVKS